MTPDALVHVVDDDEAARESLEFLLRAASFDVRTYEAPQALLASLPLPEGGCIVTDVRMPGMTGLEMLQRLNELDILLPVVVITGHGDVPLAVEAMKLGAADFIEKPFSENAILAAVRGALTRTTTPQSDETAEIVARIAGLTQREKQVLDGVVGGQSNKVVALALGISPRTVEIYRANVMTKMGAESLSDLVRMALTAEGGRGHKKQA